MQKQILGIILSILGISGLILAIIYINQAIDNSHVNIICACGVVGTLVFFAGIWMIPKSSPNKAVEAVPHHGSE
ncbi:MAG TPA: hypothetical protein VK563_05520 [Puia sp.]|nr:hypothetical protein [Puia sp.]